MNTLPLTLPAAAGEAPLPEAPAASTGRAAEGAAAQPFGRLRSPRDAHRVTLEFTASGSEYFRIWIVNLLLTLLTLGLYRPWAKVRQLRYFYANTLVAGHGLDFHGRPWQMLRGMLLAGALLLLYSVGSESESATAVLAAALAALMLWPLMLRASLQFRLAHTSWRGLRFGFVGTAAGAYRAVGLPLALVLMPAALGAFFAQDALPQPDELPAAAPALAALMLGMLLAVPYFHWRLMQYRHGHFRLGAMQSELRLGAGRVYGLYLRSAGLALLLPFAFGLLAAALGGLSSLAGLLFILLPAFYVLLWAYFTVGLQNLAWSRTGNRYLRFRSELSLPPYLLLQLKNLLLLVVTLGLYWPWAAVANRRMRLEAVTLVSRVDLEELAQALQQPGRGLAAADAAGDLLGLDFGV